MANHSLGRTYQLREAILLTFCDPVPWQCVRLRYLSGKEWKQMLHWLDTSGLALYFFDRMTELGLCDTLPPAIFSRLQQNLLDSTARIDAMIAESTAIHRGFQSAGLSYATLKGFSLWPVSVPKVELRSQLDIDFLMAEKDASEARQILEARGYHLHAISGRSWEFKANQSSKATLKDLYKATPSRSVELHIETGSDQSASLLNRSEVLSFRGVCMPVLPPVDLFLGQGLHLYKHLCGEFTRMAHLVEFRRHVIARYSDDVFWRDLRKLANGNSRASMGLGFVILLTSRVMGDFAPKALTCWTVDPLPVAPRLWIEMYGSRTVYDSFSGSKLYLLLQNEMQKMNLPVKRSLRQALLPYRLPPALSHAEPGETLFSRIRRHRRQVHYVFSRLRFHITEGLRYLIESVRWRRRMNELEQ
jgi:hypothetical protein